MAARAAEEDIANGEKNVTPYWRTLKGKGELNDKQAKHLTSEGHSIEMNKSGKPKRVKDWEKKLVEI
jgi:hypothetical protein